jgi:hypothetical protein
MSSKLPFSGFLSFLSNKCLKVLRGVFYWRDAIATGNPKLIAYSAFCMPFVLHFARDVFFFGLHIFCCGKEEFMRNRKIHLTGKKLLLKPSRFWLFYGIANYNPFPVYIF